MKSRIVSIFLCVMMVTIVFAITMQTNMSADSSGKLIYPKGIISYWKFDEGSGTRAYDSVGDNDGTINGAEYTTGQVDGALKFDGGGDYVRVANSPELMLAKDFTYSFWAKRFSNNNYQTILDKGHKFFIDWRADLYKGVQGCFGFWCHINGLKCIHASNPVNDFDYHFYTYTYDGIDFKSYVDGVEDEVQHNVGEIEIDDSDLYFGSYGGTYPLNGIIDDVAIFNRPLPPEEIQLHYQNGLKGFGYLGIPFSTFIITTAEITYNQNPNEDEYVIEGEFTLNIESDGIDPVGEDVLVKVGNSITTIMANSFLETKKGFEFEGIINGAWIRIEIKQVAVDVFMFYVEAKGVDLTGTANPIDIFLQIKDDHGSNEVRLVGTLKLKK